MHPDLTGRSLLAVFAHPDDESLACGGLLAWCAERGARVSLVCATRGGSGASPASRPTRSAAANAPLDGSDLVQARGLELAAAARVLGITDVLVLDHEDGMLPWVDAARLERDISDAIRRCQPDVVVTFGEDGLYWHPDHIAIHERTTAAVAALVVSGADISSGAGPCGPRSGKLAALYYVTMPPGRMRAVMDAAAARQPKGLAPRFILGVADADAFGTLAAEPTLVVEAGPFALRKLAAIRCHRTQLTDDALDALSESDALRLLGTEHYRRAEVGARGDTFLENLRGQTPVTDRLNPLSRSVTGV